MEKYLEKLPAFIDEIRAIKETIITNIVLIGQIPSPTFHEQKRAEIFMERLIESQVDECTIDDYQNPIGIIRGTSKAKPPIFLVAHLDTFFGRDVDHNFTVKKNSIMGPGIMDNSAGVAVLCSLPEIFQKLNLSFESDIVLAGVVQSIGKGNLRGIRRLLKNWGTPIKGAICIEGGELGRLNYYSDGMIRCEIECNILTALEFEHKFRPNAIVILNEVINQILEMRLPQRPRARVIIGKISGGFKHGRIAFNSNLGFEIQSDSDDMVMAIYNDIKDIVDGISHEFQVELNLKTISNINARTLKYNHPMVKNTVKVMKQLGLKPVSEPSEAELSIFLSRNIPAVTIGITHGERYHLENSEMEIDPIFTGIAQLIGIITALDSGACDEE